VSIWCFLFLWAFGDFCFFLCEHLFGAFCFFLREHLEQRRSHGIGTHRCCLSWDCKEDEEREEEEHHHLLRRSSDESLC
jgi:hypothetical protein